MLASTISFALFASLALAAPAPARKNFARKYPFKQVVAFGDNLSDNGNGSYAWCIADPGHCTNAIYGHRTWTDGPVAVSYLTDMIDVPLTNNFAIGHRAGGSKFGSTIKNSYTQSQADVPDAYDQIANYTGSPSLTADIADTLHFLWTGANDLNLYHINTGSTDNSKFADEYSDLLVGAVQNLMNAGAEHVFVPGLYAKEISPSIEFYAGVGAPRTNFGLAIQQANAAIKSKLASNFGTKVLYYDVYSKMIDMYNNGAAYGFTHLGGEFCDGYSQPDWDLCVTDGQGSLFMWMQYLDMTSYAHKYIAQDMANAVYLHKWAH